MLRMEKDNLGQKKNRLIMEIAFVIACKLVLIFCLWFFFFSPEHRTIVTDDKIDEIIFFSEQPKPSQTATESLSTPST